MTLGAAVFERRGDENAPSYALARVFLQTEQLALNSQSGVRDIDSDAAWFALSRNATIKIARSLLDAGLLRRVATSVPVYGEITSDKTVLWMSGAKPDSHAPLLWFARPARFNPLMASEVKFTFAS